MYLRTKIVSLNETLRTIFIFTNHRRSYFFCHQVSRPLNLFVHRRRLKRIVKILQGSDSFSGQRYICMRRAEKETVTYLHAKSLHGAFERATTSGGSLWRALASREQVAPLRFPIHAVIKITAVPRLSIEPGSSFLLRQKEGSSKFIYGRTEFLDKRTSF